MLESHLRGKVLTRIITGGRYKNHGQFEGYGLRRALPLRVLYVGTRGKLIIFMFENISFVDPRQLGNGCGIKVSIVGETGVRQRSYVL